MTKDRYLTMCEQLGKEPSDKEIPPGWEDLPEIVQVAINIFNSLGDKVYPEIGYTGKDYMNLPILMDLYYIENTEFFLEVLFWLDARTIKKSSEQLKKELNKLKSANKSGGKKYNPT